jgi:hypothetical protein
MHANTRMSSRRIPVGQICLCVMKESFLRSHISSKRNEQFFIVTPVRSLDEILPDIPAWIVGVNRSIEESEDIIPFFLFFLAS